MKIFVINEDNKHLMRAYLAKNDEFYTRYEDIEKELIHYEKELKDKIIYCNCDSINSNFLYYFALNFNRLKLKKLICTGLKSIGVELSGINENKFTKKELMNLIKSNKRILSDKESIRIKNKNIAIKLFKLISDDINKGGDFNSIQSIELLKKCDIVVTNPPFSLFRDLFKIINYYNKKFLLIGNETGIGYKDIFPLIRDRIVRIGLTFPRYFFTPDYKDEGREIVNCVWFTNLKGDSYPDFLELIKTYNSKEYPKLDNYRVINVNKTKDIPKNYKGVMAVPVSFLTKYNPNQFKIVGMCKGDFGKDFYIPGKYYGRDNKRAILKGKVLFIRLLIKKI